MAKREDTEPPHHAPDGVAAAEHLRGAGWWGIDEKDRRALAPLVGSGLSVGVNLNFGMLGLKPALVLARVRGRENLWDVAGEGSFAVRSYRSSSLHDVMLAAPPVGIAAYRAYWHSKQKDGTMDAISVRPLEDIRLLTAQIPFFNEERRSFDFAWDSLPRRAFDEPEGKERQALLRGDVILALNEIMKNPTAESLKDISGATGVGPKGRSEATRLVREFPIGWGFHGPGAGQAGLIVYYHSLREDAFGAIRASIRNVPYAALEAWGNDSDGFIYFAELVVPAEALAETVEYVGRVSSVCGDSFSSGFYETSQLQSYPLSRKIADGDSSSR